MTPVSFTLPLSIATRVIDHAQARGIPKAQAYRELLLAGLEAAPDGQLDGQTAMGGDD